LHNQHIAPPNLAAATEFQMFAENKPEKISGRASPPLKNVSQAEFCTFGQLVNSSNLMGN